MPGGRFGPILSSVQRLDLLIFPYSTFFFFFKRFSVRCGITKNSWSLTFVALQPKNSSSFFCFGFLFSSRTDYLSWPRAHRCATGAIQPGTKNFWEGMYLCMHKKHRYLLSRVNNIIDPGVEAIDVAIVILLHLPCHLFLSVLTYIWSSVTAKSCSFRLAQSHDTRCLCKTQQLTSFSISLLSFPHQKVNRTRHDRRFIFHDSECVAYDLFC